MKHLNKTDLIFPPNYHSENFTDLIWLSQFRMGKEIEIMKFYKMGRLIS